MMKKLQIKKPVPRTLRPQMAEKSKASETPAKKQVVAPVVAQVEVTAEPTPTKAVVRCGERRVRGEWKKINELLSRQKRLAPALAVLHDLLLTTKYSISKVTSKDTVTGDPLEVKWIPVVLPSIPIYYSFDGNSTGDFTFPPFLEDFFKETLTKLRTDTRPVIFMSQENNTEFLKDSAGSSTYTKVPRILVFSLDILEKYNEASQGCTHVDALRIEAASFGDALPEDPLPPLLRKSRKK